MELQYDIWLVLVSQIASGLATYVAFAFISHLYRSSASAKLWLLPTYSVAIGSAIWGVHLLNWLASHTETALQFSAADIVPAWMVGCLIGLSLCYTASKKTIPFKLLLGSSFIASLCSYAMFYLTAIGMHHASNIAFDPISLIIAFLMAFAVSMLAILTLSWMKEYAGENPLLVKVILSLITAAAIMGLHITFSTSINVHTNAQVATEYAVSDKKLLTAIIALSIVCLFLLVFAVAMFYEKFGKKMFRLDILNIQNRLNVHVLDAKDALTNLPNRRAFQHHLEAASKRCIRTCDSFAIAFIDLDHFKPINDHGHVWLAASCQIWQHPADGSLTSPQIASELLLHLQFWKGELCLRPLSRRTAPRRANQGGTVGCSIWTRSMVLPQLILLQSST